MPEDERDTMFARMALDQGSETFRRYYEIHPENKEVDDHIRLLPNLGSNETPTFDRIGSPVADALFRMLADLRPLAEGEPKSVPVESDPRLLSRWVKGLALYLGANDVGIAAMEPELYYSHRGRQEISHGQPVDENFPRAVAIISAMDARMIHKGPKAPVMMESASGYLKSGVTAIAVAYAIREMGYRARAHMDGNYLVVASRVAVAAGLGAFGRSGLVIHRRFGPCARISVVTTDMPMVPDSIDPAGNAVRSFCELCGRCSAFCPGGAIPSGTALGGAPSPWPLNAEKCYETWRRIGTDCGICISSCPFTAGLDWKELEDSQGREEALEEILLRCGGKGSPRPFDPAPPGWWR